MKQNNPYSNTGHIVLKLPAFYVIFINIIIH